MARDTRIDVPELQEERVRLNIEGISPLVVNTNHFSVGPAEDKSVKGKAKECRNPEQEYLDSIHWIDQATNRSGFPARGFKAACVTAGQLLKDKAFGKAKVRGAFFIDGDLIEIFGDRRMRADIVRLRGLTPDTRYRAEYFPWTAAIEFVYADRVLKLDQILQLFNVAGSRVGIGEDRPEKGGGWGRFKIVDANIQVG
jgi:hypothetical protein